MPPRTHLLTRSRTAVLADHAFGRLWRTGIDSPPRLEADFLWTRATRRFSGADEQSGRSPHEVADFRQRLDLLCRSLRDEARLNNLGLVLAYGQITTAIRTRHALGRLWRQKPGIGQTPMAPPIIVVGQMRSGTTRLHRLLAADPAHGGTPLYRAFDPVRPAVDLRPVKTMAALALARAVNPWIDALHPFGALRVDEEISWLGHALIPAALEAQYRIPSYIAASEARDAAPAYREFARVLRTDAALSGTAHLPRVLKCPQYAEDLGPLLRQFPDARLVVARRDHEAVLASTVSLVASQMACQSGHADLPAIEREWRRKIALREERMAQGLAQFAGPVAEVHFRALDQDWQGEMVRVYRQLGLDLSVQAQAAMSRLQQAARRSPHRQHRRLMQQVAEV